MNNNNPLDTLHAAEWDALITSIIKPFFSVCKKDSSIGTEDLKQEAWIGLLKASERYDPSQSKFTTFAYHYIRGYVMTYIASRTKNKQYQIAGDPQELDVKSYVDNVTETNDMMRTVLEILSDQDHVYLLEEHFVKDKSFRQIAKEQKVSHESIANRVHKLLNILYVRLNHENS